VKAIRIIPPTVLFVCITTMVLLHCSFPVRQIIHYPFSGWFPCSWERGSTSG